jgi:hypothetical protein
MMAFAAGGAANDRLRNSDSNRVGGGRFGEALCGKYPVPENRELKEGRKIALNIVVLPAQNPSLPLIRSYFRAGQAATKLANLCGTFAEVR